jgi:Zn-dependent peptidase ImmA (M78 family)
MVTRAEQAAEQVFLESGARPPVDVYRVARARGIDVLQQELEESVSGVLVIRASGPVIGVNQGHPKNRQRFTIAHELGHWELHKHAGSVFIDTTSVFYRDQASSDGSKTQEIEANRFAAALLMPHKALEEAVGWQPVDPLDEETFRRLAARFGVSTQALGFRLVRLGLVEF